MNKIVAFIFLLAFSIVNSQNNQMLIEYSLQFEGAFLDQKRKMEMPALVDLFEGIEEKLNSVKFNLYYENGKSLFKSLSEMVLDDEPKGFEMARTLSGQENIYYRDIKDKKLIIGHPEYNVLMDYDNVKWNITGEEKIIDGLKCFKATANDSRRSKELTAWFCPEIPLALGPIEYGGLPGLILELSFGKFKYMATAINLNYNGKEKITLPSKTISEAEQMGVLHKRMQSLN